MIRKNKQLIVDQGKGDCYRACITSILGLPNSPKLIPSVDDPKWYTKYNAFLQRFGLQMVHDPERIWINGYWIASVKSKNFPPPTTHAIVMKFNRVFWDPSTKKKYRAGSILSGVKFGGDVHSGTWLVVVDASKLYKLKELKKTL